MRVPYLLLLTISLLFPASLAAQSSKKIAEKEIVSRTVYEYFIAEGMKKPVVESEESFDERGNLIEYKEYSKEGKVKAWQKFKYNEEDDEIEELILDDKGKQKERIEWIYDGRFITEKLYYDQKDRLVKRKEYKYEYRK